MADKQTWEVELDYTSKGAQQKLQELSKLQDQVDGLARGSVISSKDQERLSKSIYQSGRAAHAGAVDYGGMNKALAEMGLTTRKLSEDNNQATESIVAMRYAQYDLASTMLSASAAITAAGVGTVVAFAQQERAFADVERTAEGALGNIREELMRMSTEIPLAFSDLAGVATLGNQLGIATEDIGAFTETIAQFATVTGITYDQSAQAFGKLGNLLNVSAQDYDRLGSSIALVGRTTAATEQQIISVANEIAPAAAAAGFTADQVIGLSGALSSLRVPPERSRSTILQFFETLNMAVANGGKDLDNFSKVVGVTSSELDKMVRAGQGQDILTRFIGSTATKDTIEVTQALQELGLAGLRTNPTIRALAGNTQLMSQALADGKQGWTENIELQRQMDIILDTLSSKWTIFVNALVNAGAAIGSEVAPAMGTLLTVATDLLVGFAEFAESPVGQQMIRLAAAAASLSAAFLAVRGVIALATGSALAMQFALRGLGGLGIINGLRGLASALGLTQKTAEGATVAAFTLRGALLAVGRAVVIGAVLQYVAEWIFNTGDAAIQAGQTILWFAETITRAAGEINALFGSVVALSSSGLFSTGNFLVGMGKDLNARRKQTEDFGASVGNLNDLFNDGTDLADDFAGGIGDVGSASAAAAQEVRTLLDYAGDLAKVWDRAFDIRFSGQSTLDTITSSFLAIREAADEAAKRIRDLNNDIASLSSDIDIQEYFLSIAVEYGDTKRAAAIEATLAKKRAELADKTTDLQKEQDASNKSLVGNSKGAIENRKTITDLVKQYQGHIAALAASGMSSEDLARKTAQLKADFMAQAAQLGYNSTELNVYASAFDDVAIAIANIPRNITVVPNLNPALQALNEFVAAARKAGTDAGNGLSSGINSGLSAAQGAANSRPIRMQYQLPSYSQLMAMQEAIRQQTGDRTFRIGLGPGGQGGQTFAEGGYTGSGGKYAPAGIVHRGEYVIPKRDVNQSTGLPNIDALGRLMGGVSVPMRGRANGSPAPARGTSQVALTAGTIQAIAHAVQPHLYLDGEKVAQATSRADAFATEVGAN